MPPSFDIAIAKSTSTTPSIAAPQIGTSSASRPRAKVMSTSAGLIVTAPGTSATSSNPYARRARRPIPISRPASLAIATECRVCLLLRWAGFRGSIPVQPSSRQQPQRADVPGLHGREVAVIERGQLGLTQLLNRGQDARVHQADTDP